MAEHDPIRDRYYTSVERMNLVTEGLFYLGAVLSFAAPVIDQAGYPHLYGAVLTTFVIAVVLLFMSGLAQRLYFMPRAEQKRREDFLTQAFGVSLTHENAEGYYNNPFEEPGRRVGAQVLENTFFTKALVLRMAQSERVKGVVYFIVWLGLIIKRTTDLDWILIASQALFSEQIVSKWLRLEWLRAKSERIYQEVYKLFQAKASATGFLPLAIDALLAYECAKSIAAILIPSRLFRRVNKRLSAEWEKVAAKLALRSGHSAPVGPPDAGTAPNRG